MRVARVIAWVLLARQRPTRRVSRRGISWKLDLREAIDLSIYLTGRFQRSVIRELTRIARADGVIIDIGANRGAIVLPLADLLRNHKFVAIEPVPDLVDVLCSALRDNPSLAERVTVVRRFLNSENQQVPPQVDASWNVFSDTLYDKVSPAGQIGIGNTQASTLDQLVQEQSISAIAAIKVDVEGYEPGVLLGASETLRRFSPPILMEWQPPLQRLRGFTPEEFAEVLSDFGYFPQLVKRFRKSKPISWNELLEKYSESYCEVVLQRQI